VNTQFPRYVKRMLVQQIAVAKYDGIPVLARAARRALRAVEAGDVSRLDADAAEALKQAENFSVLFDADLDTTDDDAPNTEEPAA